MKKLILIPIILGIISSNSYACDIFNGPWSAPSYYGCNNGSIQVTTDFNLVTGNFFLLTKNGYAVSNWVEVPDNSSFTWQNLSPGYYVVYFEEYLGNSIWCSESRAINVADVSLNYNINFSASNATTPTCNDGFISGSGNYALNNPWVTAYNLSNNQTYYGSFSNQNNFQINNLTSGYYFLSITGYISGTCQTVNTSNYLTVGTDNNCNITTQIYSAAGCSPGGGSMLVVNNANGQPVNHYTTELVQNNAVVISATYTTAEHNFTNLESGNYTVITRTYPENGNQCYCENILNEVVGTPSSLFYSSQISSVDPSLHYCGNDGYVNVTVPNLYNPSFLTYWQHPYMSYYNFYLYDANWNQLKSASGYTGCSFAYLAAGDYYVLTIGSRFDAMFCYVPEVNAFTLNDPPCNLAIFVIHDGVPQECQKNVLGYVQNYCFPVSAYLYRQSDSILIDSAYINTGYFGFTIEENGNYFVTTTDPQAGCTASTVLQIGQVICPVPLNISHNQLTNKKVIINWDAVECAIGYNVQLRIKGTSAWNTYYINEANGASKTFGNLFQGINYEYRVRTKCSSTFTSAYSPKYSFCLNCASKEMNIESDDPIVVMPNPATDFVNININRFNEENTQLVIYDLLGNIKYSQRIDCNTLQVRLDLSNFSSGIYLVQLLGMENCTSKRLIISR